jgi:hypothetical protein
VRIAARFKVGETAHGCDRGIGCRLEPGDHGKWSAGVARGLRNAPGSLDLIDASVEDDHLAVEIGERAEAEISMFEDRLHLTSRS